MIDLKSFQKPQRYVGNEWNVVKKSHNSKLSICLSYPDLYEIGMSNLGLRIIYGMLNEYEDVVCERAFLPGEDLAGFMAANKYKLFSLETKTSLDEFDAVGFNFNCELNFVNFLYMLWLSGIPITSKERKNQIIFGGGIANPEPLAEFVDLFYLGEFEAGMSSFVEIMRKYKNKDERLKAFSEIDGFYVPSLYSANFNGSKYEFDRIYSNAKLPLKRTHVKNLDESYYPLKWLTPHTSIIHDRVPIEIARGCPNKCTFCQARALYYPYREKTPQTVYNIIKQIYKNSGYENFSLLSLSASDHSEIVNLVDSLIDEFTQKRIGLSLPSLRVDDILGNLYPKLFFLKKTSLTVAIETANEHLRGCIGKKIDINKLFEALKVISSLKVKHIKLYFMLGFQEETDNDLNAIGYFLDKINRQSRIALNVSINVFIPKPFSLWEGASMCREDELRRRIQIIMQTLPKRGAIKVNFSQPAKSILEAIISRADRSFSSVIKKIFDKVIESGKLDVCSSWDAWQEAMQEEKVDYQRFLNVSTQNFPWSFIN